MEKISKKRILVTALMGVMMSLIFIGRPSEAKSSYEVYYHDKNILTVNVMEAGSQLSNGYYQVEFEIPGTGKKAFITGLTAENVQETQKSLIDCYTDESDFSIYNLDYIDTEKTDVKGYDSDLCWAAQAADMLTYAGWTKKAGFKNEDDVFDLFSEVFTDIGGQSRNGISWFLSGYTGSASLKSDKKGGYLRDYPPDMVFETDNIVFYNGIDGNKPYKFFRKMMKALRKGKAIGLDVDWVEGSEAHAITLFGYIYNTSYKDTSLKHYDSFIIADSDSDKGGLIARRNAPNSLKAVRTKKYKGEAYESLIMDRYGNGAVTTLNILKPYSDGLARETDPRATRDVTVSPDIRVTSVVTSTSDRPYASDDPYLAAGQDIHLRLNVENNSAVGYNAPCTIYASVADKDGKILQNVEATGDLSLTGTYVEMIDAEAVFSPLSEGEYTIEGRVEPGPTTKEAYLINNTFKKTITVKKTETDPSAVSLKVSVPDFKNGLVSNAKITYSDPSYILDNGFENSIAVSYFNDGKWSPYTEIYSTTDIASEAVGNHNLSLAEMTNYKNGLLKTIDVGKDGTAVSVRLGLFKDGTAPIYYYSNPCDLKYLSLKAIGPADEINFDPIPYEANALANSQNIEFSFENNSTYDGGKISGSYYIYAESWEDSSLKYEIAAKKEISLAYGEKKGPIRINSWSNKITPAGQYYINMCFYDSVTKSEEIVSLGVISVCEKPSTKVTMVEDTTDPLDGGISLREAVVYASSGKTKGKKITFDKSTRNDTILLKKPIEIDSDIQIEGIYKSNGYAYAHKLYNPQGGVFDVKKGASLSINGFILSNNLAIEGGAINADNADVTISNCRISNVSAENAGGGVRAKNSKVLIKNTTFEGCQAPVGEAIYVTDSTTCHILNCIFQSNSGLAVSFIENSKSTLDIVSSSIVENSSYSDENSSLIKSDGTTRVLGSVICKNIFSQVAKGSVHFYGNALVEQDGVTEDAVLDTLTQKIEKTSDMYYTSFGVVDSREKFDPKAGSATNEYVLVKELCTKDVKGVIIEPTDSGLVYGSDTAEKLESKIPVLFPKEDYEKDMYEDVRTAVYGSDATPYVEPVIGHSPITIKNKQIKKKNAETYIGRAVSDAIKLTTKSDIALITTSELLAGIKKGDVTAPMIKQVIGEQYIIVRKKIKGADIKKMLEKSIDYMLKDKTKYSAKTLQLAGLTVTYKASAKKGKRIKKIMVGKKAINNNKTYKVAMDYATAYQKPYSGYGEVNEKAKEKYWDKALETYFNKSSSYIKKSVKQDRYIS